MKVSKVLVTPSYAKDLLERNVRNRKIYDKDVTKYAKEMSEDKWKQNTGEMIKISKTNVILDGQHRLLAVIKSNKSVYFHIAEGLEDEVFDVLDTGKLRSAVDCFKIEGIKNETLLPSIIRKYRLLKQGKLTDNGRNNEFTNSKLIEYYKQREPFWNSVAKKTKTWYNDMGKILPTSSVGGLYALFYDISPDYSNDFMNQLCKGENVTNPSITALRKRLIASKTNRQQRVAEDVKHAIIIKTWNAFRTNREIKSLKFDAEIETFPTPM